MLQIPCANCHQASMGEGSNSFHQRSLSFRHNSLCRTVSVTSGIMYLTLQCTLHIIMPPHLQVMSLHKSCLQLGSLKVGIGLKQQCVGVSPSRSNLEHPRFFYERFTIVSLSNESNCTTFSRYVSEHVNKLGANRLDISTPPRGVSGEWAPQ